MPDEAQDALEVVAIRKVVCSHFGKLQHCIQREQLRVDALQMFYYVALRFLYKGIIIKHNKTEPTYTKTSLFLCEKRRFFMGRTEKGGKVF